MALEHIRLSQQARDQLITLKRRTGVQHWNVLCRWALCRSLAEVAPPPLIRLTLDSNVEMDWRTFGGDLGDVFWALVRLRCHQDGLSLDDETVAQQLRLHLHRGIGYLVGDPRVTDVAGLAGIALEELPAT
ncbi:DNA sulfur modification protein DndE [Pseudonocardia sp. ICBG601]|uniref:DNA sulfur modification protein DndE n=1 Tax=Pseudonocardia sp. ICBG601 TaxID=2846759 RepID=UPI001CF676F3|nr:DNA sulfur modification protein DndE [Pseudonocardia sp. ICBG601]